MSSEMRHDNAWYAQYKKDFPETEVSIEAELLQVSITMPCDKWERLDTRFIHWFKLLTFNRVDYSDLITLTVLIPKDKLAELKDLVKQKKAL